jgi:hypothetical protein
MAGPIEYQPSPIAVIRRCGCQRRVKRSGTRSSSDADAIATGTIAGGSTKSIGTNTTCVGTAYPPPMSNWSLPSNAALPTSSTRSRVLNGCDGATASSSPRQARTRRPQLRSRGTHGPTGAGYGALLPLASADRTRSSRGSATPRAAAYCQLIASLRAACPAGSRGALDPRRPANCGADMHTTSVFPSKKLKTSSVSRRAPPPPPECFIDRSLGRHHLAAVLTACGLVVHTLAWSRCGSTRGDPSARPTHTAPSGGEGRRPRSPRAAGDRRPVPAHQSAGRRDRPRGRSHDRALAGRGGETVHLRGRARADGAGVRARRSAGRPRVVSRASGGASRPVSRQPSRPRMSCAVIALPNRSPSSMTPLNSAALRRARATTFSSIVSRAIVR